MKRLRPRIDPNASNAPNVRKRLDALSLPDDVWRVTIDNLRPWELIWLSRTCHRMLRLCGPGTLAWRTANMLRYGERLRPMLPLRWLGKSPHWTWSAVLESFDAAREAANADAPTNRDDELLPFRTWDRGIVNGDVAGSRRRTNRSATIYLDDALLLTTRAIVSSLALATVAEHCSAREHDPEPDERCCRSCSCKVVEIANGTSMRGMTAMRAYRCRKPREYYVCFHVRGNVCQMSPVYPLVFPVEPVVPILVEDALVAALKWHSVKRPPYVSVDRDWTKVWPMRDGDRVSPEEWSKSLES